MKRFSFLLLAAAMFGGGYYLINIYTSVSPLDQAACEEGYRQQFAGQQDVIDSFLHQCRNPAVIIAGAANGNQISAEDAAAQMSAANRNHLIKLIAGYGLMGGGIGAVGAAFARKKRTA